MVCVCVCSITGQTGRKENRLCLGDSGALGSFLLPAEIKLLDGGGCTVCSSKVRRPVAVDPLLRDVDGVVGNTTQLYLLY